MILFELFASLGLDTSSFREAADEAVGKGESVAESVEDSFKRIQSEATIADTKLDEAEKKAATTNAIIDGLVQATGDIVKEAIEDIVAFGERSIETASATGSALAESFLKAKDNFNVTMEALELKIGNTLLPLAEGFYELFAAATGVTDAEKFQIILSDISEYEFENIETLRTSLGAVFGMFEEAGTVEAASISDMTAGLESQAKYWNDYADTLENLRERDIDPQFLADIADGTAKSLETLKALEAADTTELSRLMEAFEAVEETKRATVESIREFQIALDEDLLTMTQSIEELVAGMNQEDAARANLALTASAVNGEMEGISAAVTHWVNNINSELSRIGAGYSEEKALSNAFLDAQIRSFTTNEMGFNLGYHPHASGLPYTPYDGYRAELHRGEAVLTRQEAEEYRASGTGRATDSNAVVRKLDDVVAAIRGLVLSLDGEIVGHMITPYVSGEIGREAGVFL